MMGLNLPETFVPGGQVATPMISLRSSGFVAKIRTQFREHCGMPFRSSSNA